MNKYKFYFLLPSFLGIMIVNAQKNINSDKKGCDSIMKNQFFNLATELKNEMEVNQLLSEDKIMEIIKVNNTMILSNVTINKLDSELAKNYQKIFNSYYNKNISFKFKERLSKYSTIYLEKLDIFVLNAYVIMSEQYRCKDVYIIY